MLSIKTLKLIAVLVLACATSDAAWAAEPESPLRRQLAQSEGDTAGRAVVELRGRNIVDDWVELVRDLERSNEISYIEVSPAPGGGLCQTYTVALGLPGCTKSLLSYAIRINPKIDPHALLLSDRVKIPVLPLHADRWSAAFDTSYARDARKLEDLQTRWANSIIGRQEKGDFVRLTMQSYKVYLPAGADSAMQEFAIKPKFDDRVEDHLIQKRSVIPAAPIVKQHFSKVKETFDKCIQTPEAGPDIPPANYLSLLDDGLADFEFPDCAKTCEVGKCPEINLFDVDVHLHPDLGDAVIEGGHQQHPVASAPTSSLASSSSPSLSSDSSDASSSRKKCNVLGTFSRKDHHGNMMAAIMVARNDGKAPFVGLASNSKLRAFKSSLAAQHWSAKVKKVIDRNWDRPQIIVFAGEFDMRHMPSAHNKIFPREDARLREPPVIAQALDEKLIWISAAGQPDPDTQRQPQELTPIQAKSPMNLGDQRNIIIVTSCETCTGKNARLWAMANYSRLKHGLVTVAAPGGSKSDPIPVPVGVANYATGYGTSQATAFVAGLSARMLRCFPEKYTLDGRFLKTRLQVTSDPLPNPEDAEKITGGIVNVRRALLKPDVHWIDRAGPGGPEEISDVKWCRESLELTDHEGVTVGKFDAMDIGSIIRVHEDDDDHPQWQMTKINENEGQSRWSGPGRWKDNEPILSGVIKQGDLEQRVTLTGADIVSFIPAIQKIQAIRPKVEQCLGG